MNEIEVTGRNMCNCWPRTATIWVSGNMSQHKFRLAENLSKQ